MAFALSIVILLIIAYQSESVTFEERRRHWELEDGQRRHNFTEHRHADVNAGNQTWHDGLGVEAKLTCPGISDPFKQVCCNDTVVSHTKADSASVQCCGSASYDPYILLCCEPGHPGVGRRCCGNIAADPDGYLCCDNILFPRITPNEEILANCSAVQHN